MITLVSDMYGDMWISTLLRVNNYGTVFSRFNMAQVQSSFFIAKQRSSLQVYLVKQ